MPIKINPHDGSTSIGIPGKQGSRGDRARLLFYGNATETALPADSSITCKIDNSTFYAYIIQTQTPEIGDCVIYTDNGHNYFYQLKEQNTDGSWSVKKIDDIFFSNAAETSAMIQSIDFDIDCKFRTVTTSTRDVFSYVYDIVDNLYHIAPKTETKTTKTDIFDVTVTVPPTSSYVFDSNIKLVIEFYTIQSFVMDTMMLDKYSITGELPYPSGNNNRTDKYWKLNTYFGSVDRLSVIKNGAQIDVNFDDERLENFVYVIKDFNEFVGERTIYASTPIISSSLKRAYANPKAFIYAYIKNGTYINKVYVGEFDINQLLNN